METSTWINMIVILAVVLGGFSVSLGLAMRQHGGDGADRSGETE